MKAPGETGTGHGVGRRETGPASYVPVARATVGAVAEGWDEDGLRAVRGALHRQDWVALLAALRRGPAREVLQLAGDGVAGAAARGLPGAAEMGVALLQGSPELGEHWLTV
jgi:hypothetical protein